MDYEVRTAMESDILLLRETAESLGEKSGRALDPDIWALLEHQRNLLDERAQKMQRRLDDERGTFLRYA